MIQIQNVNKSYVGKIIYEDASLNIYKNEKIGFIGRNGIGKSTLFDMIMNITSFDGNINVSKDITVGYYKQDLSMDGSLTVKDSLYKQFEDLFKIEEKMLELSYDFENNAEEYEKLFNEFEARGGYFITSTINAMVKMFKLTEVLDQTVDTLSGGQKGRLALAKVLITKPDLLLLDEPLNHLDLEAIEWLEGFLNSYIDMFIVISHDRFFLDNVCNAIVEARNYSLYKYKGNYSSYLNQSEHNDLTLVNIYEKQQAEIKSMKEQIKQYRIWGNARDSEKMFRKAKEIEKRLARIDVIDAPTVDKNMRLQFKYEENNSHNIIWCEKMAIGYEDILIDNINFDIYNGDRIAFVGANGIGKSTLLKVLAKEIEPYSGKFNASGNIKIGYFDQIFENLNNTNTIFEEVHESNPMCSNNEIRTHLAKFMFTNDMLNKNILELSGGECVRVSLAKLSLVPSNVLILDEPTNHLDLESKQIVEMALSDYPGTIIFSSHDRYLINKLANKIYEFSNDGLKTIDKNYTEYIVERDLKFEDAQEKEKSNDYDMQKQQKQKKNKIKRLEIEIDEKLQKVKELEQLKFDEEVFCCSEKYEKLLKQIEIINNEVEELIEQTLELDESL